MIVTPETKGLPVDFEDYVARHRRALFRFAAVLCADPRLADDVVSDVLGAAFELWARIGGLENPHAYVRKMVLNEYLGWRRRSRRTAVRADLSELIEAEPDHADAAADRQHLAGELRRLPPKQRAAIVLRYLEGLSFADIAALLGTGENAVRSNVSRGLAQLRVQLGDVADHPMSVPAVEANP
jgi:RNA polymerase sigma-70 factor (sigma-E family)